MGILGAVVQRFVLAMLDPELQVPLGGAVRPQLVRDQDARSTSLFLQ
jgi:hypothetical protein